MTIVVYTSMSDMFQKLVIHLNAQDCIDNFLQALKKVMNHGNSTYISHSVKAGRSSISSLSTGQNNQKIILVKFHVSPKGCARHEGCVLARFCHRLGLVNLQDQFSDQDRYIESTLVHLALKLNNLVTPFIGTKYILPYIVSSLSARDVAILATLE
jgi:hypothetical protein